MKKNILIFGIFVFFIASQGIAAEAEEYSYYYESSSEEYSLSETSELTSEDWEELEESMNSQLQNSISLADQSTTGGDFDSIKNNTSDISDTNDTWSFLLWGLLLIAAGLAVIISRTYLILRKKGKPSPARTKSNPTKSSAQSSQNNRAAPNQKK